MVSVDLLARVFGGDPDLGGTAPGHYHLGPGERLGEAMTRSFNRLTAAWRSFQEARSSLAESDPAVGLTRERWLLPLFTELGFGRLQPSKGIDVQAKSYPISHLWGAVPIHLVGAGVALDRRSAGVAGAASASPHAILQELLNRSAEHLWGIVSNGLKLRLLRDNASLVRSAYVEFDLESMMANEVFGDFALLWLLVHQSRFEGVEPLGWWIERWRVAGLASGTRALDEMRDGFADAIGALGEGFLRAPANQRLRDDLRTGALDTQDYYRQLLRLVYRFIICFVAEDRQLLHHPSAPESARDRYRKWYSTQRLREIAGRRRGGPHGDLWQGLQVVLRALATGEEILGLPALGGFLFRKGASWQQACPDLDHAELANTDLLEAVRHLAFRHSDSILSAVDFRNLGSEELGSVYESLLELHPEMDVVAAHFRLTTEAGHERKTTGSYYTPSSLVARLLDSALDPVVADAARSPDPTAAILKITVLDPACGSGHFLIAAAHRIAKSLAAVRTGEEEPPPDDIRHALREVICHCLHGIDSNDMAVELCKVNLWLESLEPGKPFGFLDHHVVLGNALLGATPALVAAGIPDTALNALTGDDPETVRSLKADNRAERSGAQHLALGATGDPYADLVAAVEKIESMPDDTVGDIGAKEELFAQLALSPAATSPKVIADAWCAAFVTEKVPGGPRITQGLIDQLIADPQALPPPTYATVERLAREYGFLHWHLAFPHVFRTGTDDVENLKTGWSGGFDVVIGNPPWDKVEFHEKEYFATRDPVIANAAGATRRRMIAALETSDEETERRLFAEFQGALRHAGGERHLLSGTGRYLLCGHGRINTYAVFAETMRDALVPTGRLGVVVPTGIATDDTTKEFFGDLVGRGTLVSLYDFENREKIFPAVDSRVKFSLLTLSGSARPVSSAEFAFFCHQVSDLDEAERRFSLTADDLALLNPNTKTCPVFRSRRDAEITRGIYERVPVLIRDGDPEGNPWGVEFRQGLFNMTSASGLFRSRDELEAEGFELEGNVFRMGEEVYVPLYEGKMVHQFDHRWAGVDVGEHFADTPVMMKANPWSAPLPRYWVQNAEVSVRLGEQKWLLGFRDIARATDERTVIASIVPRTGVGNKLPLMLSKQPSSKIAILGASLSSFVLDYSARQKVGGTTLNFFLVEQFPVLPQNTYDRPAPWSPSASLAEWLTPRVLELTYTAWDLAGFAADLGYDGPPFRWEEARRMLLRAELDACFFHLYGIDRDDVEYIMDTFPIVRRHDEAACGEFRTKRLILECYDAMAKAVETGVPYETALDPVPGDRTVTHPATEVG